MVQKIKNLNIEKLIKKLNTEYGDNWDLEIHVYSKESFAVLWLYSTFGPEKYKFGAITLNELVKQINKWLKNKRGVYEK